MRHRIVTVLGIAAAAVFFGGATAAVADPRLEVGPATAETQAMVPPEDADRPGSESSGIGVMGSASDPDPDVFTVDSSPRGGYAEWTENGDTVKVCDIEGGGWYPRVYIYLPDSTGSPNGTVLMAVNDGSEGNGCTAYHEDVVENVPLSMKVCLADSSGVLNNTCGHISL